METTRAMTRSPVALARMAVEIAQRALPAYSHPCSRKDFTQHQLFALMVLATFLRVDHRGIVALVNDWSDIREAIGLTRVPHWSTLYNAYAREQLGIRSTVIHLNRRGERHWAKTKYRRQMYRRFPKLKYRQRAQVESTIARFKRRLTSSLRGRSRKTQATEVHLRALTHDLLLLAA